MSQNFQKKYISYGIASKDKNKRFSKLFKTEWLRRDIWSEEKFQKTLILVFEVIVQPPKHTFEIGIFSTF